MKKFVFGVLAGLAVYKVVRSRYVVAKAKAKASQFASTLGHAFLDAMIDRAHKQGLTDAEMNEFVRIVDKFAK